MVNYHRQFVCQRPADSYLSTLYNQNNFVPVDQRPDDLPLATVINVSAWIERLRGEVAIGWRLERDFGLLQGGNSSRDAVHAFLADVFVAVNRLRDERPVWVAQRDDFVEASDVNIPATWNAAVGAWRKPGAWQAVLTYPSRLVSALLRPTQLDAGFNQFHYPSPTVVDLVRGGITMALREVSESVPLVREWIHPPIPLDPRHWTAARDLFGRVDPMAGASGLVCREWHRGRLARWLPQIEPAWIPPE
jgi:hypothetical protein